jgi:hypothetical protein
LFSLKNVLTSFQKKAQKKAFPNMERLFYILMNWVQFYLCVFSSETVNFFLPFALRDFNTLRPLADAILSRKPCLFLLFFVDGWNVRNILFMFCALQNGMAN